MSGAAAARLSLPIDQHRRRHVVVVSARSRSTEPTNRQSVLFLVRFFFEAAINAANATIR